MAITDDEGPGAWIAPLVRGVSQLVRKKRTAGGRTWCKRPLAEGDVALDGVRFRVKISSRCGGVGVRVDSNVPEIDTQRPLHEVAGRRVEWFAFLAQRVPNDGLARSRGGSGPGARSARREVLKSLPGERLLCARSVTDSCREPEGQGARGRTLVPAQWLGLRRG